MDIKEILPFIVLVAISIIGSLTKKKPQKGVAPSKRKNVFESLLDEIQNEVKGGSDEFQPQNDLEPEEQAELEPAPVYQTLVEQFEENRSINLGIPEDYKAKQNDQYIEHHHTIIPQRKKKKSIVHFATSDDVKKAFIYSEVFNRKHF